jgi:hypothetical protein
MVPSQTGTITMHRPSDNVNEKTAREGEPLTAIFRRELERCGNADVAAKRVEDHCKRMNVLRGARAS